MYPISNAFLTAVKANTRKYYWTGRITTKGGALYEFDQDDMVKGSGYITSQCRGSTEVVREYCDAGKSGKNITGRPEFSQMLNDVAEERDGEGQGQQG